MKTYTDPDFKSKLISAVNDNRLIIFVGAGVSRLCGLPSWDKAANDLLAHCFDEGLINYATWQRIIKTNSDAKFKITMGYHLLHGKDETDNLYIEWMKKEFSIDKCNTEKKKECNDKTESNEDKNDDRTNIEKIRSYIYGMSHIIFSTNVDLLLDEGVQNKFYKRDDIYDIGIERIRKNAPDKQIWHLHGSLDMVQDVVFTTKEYLERYSNDIFRENLHNFLKDNYYSILFIGYGLSELQLLDFLVNSKDSTAEGRRFYLKPYYSKDKELYDAEEPYYDDYGIQTIAYDIDEKGYDALIDVLGYLNDEIKNKSIKPTHEYELVKNSLHSICDDENKEKVKSNFKDLDKIFQSNLMQTLSYDNTYLSDWLCFIIHQYQFLFLMNGMEKGQSVEDIDFQIKNTCYLLNSICKCNDSFPLELKTDVAIKLFRVINKNDNLYNDYRLIEALLPFTFSDYRMMDLKEAQEYAERYVGDTKRNVQKPLLGYLNFYSQNELLKAEKGTALFFCKLLIENRINSNSRRDHNFSVFVDRFASAISKKYPVDCFDLCFNSIKTIVSSDRSEYSFSGDCFDAYKKNKKTIYASKEKDIIRWLLFSLEAMDEKTIKIKFAEFKNKSSKFEVRLAIYMCNLRFKDLRSEFFEWLNSLGAMRYYSEIYSLFDENKAYFNADELQQIVSFIRESTFDSTYYLNDISCKVDLCSIFINHVMQSEPFDYLTNSMLASLTQEQLSALPVIEPNNRSKLIWEERVSFNTDTDFVNNLASKNTEQLITYFKNINNTKILREKERDVENSFHLIYPKLEQCQANDIFLLPSFMIYLFLEKYMEEDQSITTPQKISFLKKMLDGNVDKVYIFKVFDILSMSLQQSSLKLSEWQKDGLFDYILSKMQTILKDDDWNAYANFYVHPSHMDFSNLGAFNFLCFLIQIAGENDCEKLTTYLDGLLKKENHCTITKASVVFDFDKMLNLNSEWIFKNIECLFDNVVKGNNYSFVIFNYSYVVNPHLLEEMNKNGVLIRLLESKEFSENTSFFASKILMCYMENSLNQDVIQTIFVSKIGQQAFMFFLQDYDFESGKDIGSKLSDILCSARNYIKDKNTDIVVELLSICRFFSSSIKEDILNCALSIAKHGFEGYEAQNIIPLFENSVFQNEDKKKIAFSLANNFFNVNRYFDDILRLFDKVDWGDDEASFNKLVSFLQEKSPDLAAELVKEHKHNRLLPGTAD